jgi:hypothetical protein
MVVMLALALGIFFFLYQNNDVVLCFAIFTYKQYQNNDAALCFAIFTYQSEMSEADENHHISHTAAVECSFE